MTPRSVRSAILAAGCAIALFGATALGQSGELFPGVPGVRPPKNPPPRPVTPPETKPAPVNPDPAPVYVKPPEPPKPPPKPVPPPPPPKPKKPAAPTEADAASADKLILEVLGEDFNKAKTNEQKVLLAKKLLSYAEQEKTPATKYVMIVKAKNFALECADTDLTLSSLDLLDAGFELDSLKLGHESLIAASKTVTTPAQRLSAYAIARKLIDRALDAQRFDIARALSELCVTQAKASNDANLQKEAAALASTIHDAEQGQSEIKDAMAAIAAKPDDPAANLKVGTYLCFTKGEWESGLKNLSRGSDQALADLAKLELAPPGTAQERLKVADGWWDASLELSELVKKRVQAHAASWYTLAVPELSGLHKAKAQKRITEAGIKPDGSGGGASSSGSGTPGSDKVLSSFIAGISADTLPPQGQDFETALNSGQFSKLRDYTLSHDPTARGPVDVSVAAEFSQFSRGTFSTPSDPRGRPRYHATFRAELGANGIPAYALILIYVLQDDRNDSSVKLMKELEHAKRGDKYQLTFKMSSMKAIAEGRKSNGETKWGVMMNANCDSGEFSAKALQ